MSTAQVAVGLALRTLAREWRSGELFVLLLAITVAVGALTGVGFLVDRVNRAVLLQASEVLGADLRVQATAPLPERYAEEARGRGLRTTRTAAIISVVFNGDVSQLTNLYAVAPGYPLRGKVKIADAPFGALRTTDDIPAAGEAWPDSRLAAALGARVGSTLSIGAATFRVGRILVSRPDQGSGFVDLAPALLMNAADVPATQLIQPGSRVSHALLFSGEQEQAAAFKGWLETNKDDSERLRDIDEESPQIGNAMTRAGRFLSLASLVSVLLCAVAVAMTARRYVQRHLDTVALLKTLGATQAFVLAVSIVQLLAVAVIATAIGAVLGFFAQSSLLQMLRGLIAADLPAPALTPVWIGLATAVLVLAGFALPPLLQLSRVPAIRILRRDVGPPRPAIWLAFGPAVAAVMLVIAWVVRDVLLAGAFVVGLVAFVLVLGLAGFLLVKLAGGLRGRVGVAWRYGLANLSRRRSESIVQILAFGLGIMALLVLAILRADLVDDWRRSLPQNAPNYFFVNIPPDERQAFEQFLTSEGGRIERMLPMIRARMTAINGEPIENSRHAGQRFARREQNLTWAAQLGADNRITAGRWWSAEDAGKPLVSVATDYEVQLGLKLGDLLAFDIGGETVEATVASFREIKWDSLQPNFFLVFPPGLLEQTAGTYMTSATFRPSEPGTIAQLVRRFPSVSVFDMDDLLAQVRSMIDKAVLAVQSVFLFTLLAGITVLLAAVQATREERRYESAMLRTLGARRSVVLQGVIVEFTAVGMLAGLLAAAGASVAGYLLATRVLEVTYTPNVAIWLAGVLGGGALVGLAGWLATRSAVSHSPATTLRAG